MSGPGMVTQFFRRKSTIEREFAHLREEEQAALKRDSIERRVVWVGRRTSDVANWCYAGIVKLLQFPAYTFDLLDRHGKPDHAKMGPFLVSQELVAICAYDVIKNGRPLQASIVIIIAVLSFASASLMRYFVGRTQAKYEASDSTSSETVNVKTTEITERRDQEKGFEASP